MKSVFDEKEPSKKAWKDFNIEVEKCKECKEPIKSPDDYCDEHREWYSSLTGSVI